MSDWRDQLLREFNAMVARLTLVADPAGLLPQEGILGIQTETPEGVSLGCISGWL